MKIIKRSGTEVGFDISKIIAAVSKANKEAVENEQLSDNDINEISEKVQNICSSVNRTLSVEEIQDLVENEIMNKHAFEVARKYITYRYKRSLIRKSNSTDDQILSLIECNNEEVKQENSNKNPIINSVQRDYMAGEVSKDITRRFLLPEDIVRAHENGIIHFHDADYFAQHMHNCCLVNLEDMLQNGTVISETMIERPKSFSTACNIATQSIAQIASSQYGGQSITLSHLAPFVNVSRQKLRKIVRNEFETAGLPLNEDKINEIAEMRVKEEIKRGVQMIQYQVITLMTTNGQAPFVTVFMYLNEVEEGQLRDDLALVIEEMLKQRILGVKNEKGVYITPAFPKLIYVLQDNNIREGTNYCEITKLAAKCTAKRLVPDYKPP
ncbi:MAG: anaerobic ribonucleoside-triphosphate reductase, partial [Oscillospiraceae bacterium]|nr:anaerobic ribonucleoside-triphosphate reductase [Oscillospiraceae bacterium]